MIACKIEDLKDFTTKLFLRDTFDGWLCREAEIVTFNRFRIDGRIRPGFYSAEEAGAAGIGAFSYWKMLRPFCCSLIKGKRLPESFSITLQLPEGQARAVMEEAAVPEDGREGVCLFLNIRYEKKVLQCVSGLSRPAFSLDRRLEQTWDRTLTVYLKTRRIPFV